MRTCVAIALALAGLAACIPPPPPQVQYGAPPAGGAPETYAAPDGTYAAPDETYGDTADDTDAQPDEAYGDDTYAAPQPAAGSDLLASLTGSWKSTNHQFQFYGDGRVRRSDAFVMAHDNTRGYKPDCVSAENEIGTVRHEGEYLIMQFDANSQYYCGERSTQASKTVRYHVEWHDNPYYEGPYFPGRGTLQLKLRDIDCTNGDMWCVDQMYPL